MFTFGFSVSPSLSEKKNAVSCFSSHILLLVPITFRHLAGVHRFIVLKIVSYTVDPTVDSKVGSI